MVEPAVDKISEACALQGFNWESCKNNWWEYMAGQADFIADCGFTVVWLPPPTDSVSREGYMCALTALYPTTSATLREPLPLCLSSDIARFCAAPDNDAVPAGALFKCSCSPCNLANQPTKYCGGEVNVLEAAASALCAQAAGPVRPELGVRQRGGPAAVRGGAAVGGPQGPGRRRAQPPLRPLPGEHATLHSQ